MKDSKDGSGAEDSPNGTGDNNGTDSELDQSPSSPLTGKDPTDEVNTGECTTTDIFDSKGSDNDTTLEPREAKVSDTTPPDGGWGWVVVGACLLGHILIVGLARGFGIFYVALKDKFEISDTAASLVPSLFNMFRMVFGPFISWLCDRYTCRVVVVIGGFIFGSGCVASAFATDVIYLAISFGVVAAIGAGCVFTPMFVVLNQYFDKNKGKAMAFATLGSGIGTIIMSVLVTVLLSEYNYPGAMLIVGGLSFNCMVVGALLRPLPKPVEVRVQEMKEIKGYDANKTALTEEGNSKDSRCSRFLSVLKERLVLVTNTTFLLYGCIIMAMPFVVNLPLVYIPPLCKEYDLPDHRTKAALLVSCMSFSDMVGRFVFGFIFDLPWVRPRRRPFHSCLGIIMGVCVSLVPFMPGVGGMAAMCIIWGFIESGFHSQRATIQATFLPKEQVANSVGFMIFFQGVGNIACTTIAGAIVDVIGTYSYTFVFGGCIMIFFASLFLAEYYIKRWLAKNDKQSSELSVA